MKNPLQNNAQQQNSMSKDEDKIDTLRARLPAQITDDVVRLMLLVQRH